MAVLDGGSSDVSYPVDAASGPNVRFRLALNAFAGAVV
jgi:hypothetical protein